MIPPRDAKELEILKQPRKLLAMTPAQQIAALDLLAATEYCPFQVYIDVYHGKSREYSVEPTMLAKQVRSLRIVFAEWPSLLHEIVV